VGVDESNAMTQRDGAATKRKRLQRSSVDTRAGSVDTRAGDAEDAESRKAFSSTTDGLFANG